MKSFVSTATQHKTNMLSLTKKGGILSRFYINFCDFKNQYRSSYLNQDVVKMSEHIANLVTARDSVFDFTANLGLYKHEADGVGVSAIKYMSNIVSWNWYGFGIRSAIDNSLLLRKNIDYNLVHNWADLENKKNVFQRCGTVQEIVCGTVIPKVSRIDKIELNTSKRMIINSKTNFTSNKNPDFKCTVFLENGIMYNYYTDLKTTNLYIFEQYFRMNHHNKKEMCNIYFIGDVKANHVFSPKVRQQLQDMYHEVCAEHLKTNDVVSKNLVLESRPYFIDFLIRGDMATYNRIPINTAKFLSIEDIRNIFS